MNRVSLCSGETIVSGSAPRFGTITGQPMACASALVRPKVSGTVEVVTATCEAR